MFTNSNNPEKINSASWVNLTRMKIFLNADLRSPSTPFTLLGCVHTKLQHQS